MVSSQIRLYADDASLFIEYNNPVAAANELNEDLAKVQVSLFTNIRGHDDIVGAAHGPLMGCVGLHMGDS